MLKTLPFIALGFFIRTFVAAGIYVIANFSDQDVDMQIEKPGGYDIQIVEPKKIGWEYKDYIYFNSKSCHKKKT